MGSALAGLVELKLIVLCQFRNHFTHYFNWSKPALYIAMKSARALSVLTKSYTINWITAQIASSFFIFSNHYATSVPWISLGHLKTGWLKLNFSVYCYSYRNNLKVYSDGVHRDHRVTSHWRMIVRLGYIWIWQSYQLSHSYKPLLLFGEFCEARAVGLNNLISNL